MIEDRAVHHQDIQIKIKENDRCALLFLLFWVWEVRFSASLLRGINPPLLHVIQQEFIRRLSVVYGLS